MGGASTRNSARHSEDGWEEYERDCRRSLRWLYLIVAVSGAVVLGGLICVFA